MDVQGTKWHRNIAENFNRLSRAHERYRRQTDRLTDDDSEREREFTFTKNHGVGADGRTKRQTEFSSLDRVCILQRGKIDVK